eukprot:Rhum_TRINITY_DN19783_c0_g1::Rhum_TRINITY_DN19783_c0_g1_i1::g.170587::m.170587
MSEGTTAVGVEQLKATLEQLKEDGKIAEYIAFDSSVRPAKKVLSHGDMDEGSASEALLTMLKGLATALQPGETFKRLSVTYPDCTYFAQVIGDYQVVHRSRQ